MKGEFFAYKDCYEVTSFLRSVKFMGNLQLLADKMFAYPYLRVNEY